MLSIRGLVAKAGDKEILHGVDLDIEANSKAVLMGLNGSGKSTLCKTVMGDPSYTIESGSIILDGEDIAGLPPNEKAKRGLFMAFQEPEEVEGLSALRFMRSTYLKLTGKKGEDFLKKLETAKEKIPFNKELLVKSLNVTASGGEKKKLEMLQMLVLDPKYALIDEFDSGLDIDSIKRISEVLNNSQAGLLIITHNPSVLNYLKADSVHIIDNGRIIVSGGSELAKKIEKEGFIWTQKKN